jgi:hypothetical protein
VDVVLDAPPPPPPRVRAVALNYVVPFVAEPRPRAPWIGYARHGNEFNLVGAALPGGACSTTESRNGGWYALEGGGYVCIGRGAALVADVVRARQRLFPARAGDAPMPYRYAVATRPAVMYRSLPTRVDEELAEPERFAPPIDDAGTDDAGSVPFRGRLEDLVGESGTPVLRRLRRGMFVSLDRAVRAQTGSLYWRTQMGGFVRSDGIGIMGERSSLQGVELADANALPLAFVIVSGAQRYRRTERGFAPAGRIPRFSTQAIAVEPAVTWRQTRLHPTRDGFFVRERDVRVVRIHEPPANLGVNERWIDVNLDGQFLVAYEGATPRLATLASTGIRHRSDYSNFETVQGEFRIQSKHIATTMDGNNPGGGVFSIEDVPWVMYFHDSFALHGAFWHQGFGYVHSHGCVNLAPADARWLFHWASPTLPPGWHAVVSSNERPGTRVFVHYDRQQLGEQWRPAHIPQH